MLQQNLMPGIGDVLVNRYELLQKLGEGGFAVVYKARDTRASGMMAVKVLHPQKSLDADFADRFRQEIHLVRQLQHPNTIKVTDAGTSQSGCLFMVMEYVSGVMLHDFIKKEGAIPQERALHIVIQVLKALREAHGKGIVHRDLKPANIMIGHVAGEDDFVKVLDFGIAKALEPEMQQVHTQAGMVICTPKYAPPEILMSRGVTPAADVYALGLIMLELLTGRPPLAATSDAEAIAFQLSPDPIAIPPMLATTPLGGVLRRALAKPIVERFKNADEMLRAIQSEVMGNTGPVMTPPHGAQLNTAATAVFGAQHTPTQISSQAGEYEEEEDGGSSVALPLVFVLILLMAGGGAAWYFLAGPGKTVAPDDDGTQVESEVTVAPDRVPEPDLGPPVEPVPVILNWGGIVAEPFPLPDNGGVYPEPEPDDLSAVNEALFRRQVLDRSASSTRNAIDMLQAALIGRAIDVTHTHEGRDAYLQLLENYIRTLVELDLCEAADRRLQTAFSNSNLVSSGGTLRIAGMRSQASNCRRRVAELVPDWSRRGFGALAEQGAELHQQLLLTQPNDPVRASIAAQSLSVNGEARLMVQAGLEGEDIRRQDRENAGGALFNLYQIVAHTLLDLNLNLTAEVELEEMVQHLEFLPEDRAPEIVGLQESILRDRQQTFSDEWEWLRYQAYVVDGSELYSGAHGMAAAPVEPTPENTPPENGTEN